MSSCATGSNRGYDELVPHHVSMSVQLPNCRLLSAARGYQRLFSSQISVVSESRLYQKWTDDPSLLDKPGFCSLSTGMLAVRAELNRLHGMMGDNNYNQVMTTPDICVFDDVMLKR